MGAGELQQCALKCEYKSQNTKIYAVTFSTASYEGVCMFFNLTVHRDGEHEVVHEKLRTMKFLVTV